MADLNSVIYKPIGVFRCRQSHPVESPRQGVLAAGNQGELHLTHELSQECLRDIDGFSKIWLIYDFHGNNHWQNLVRPPRGDSKKGVFATRSPYRPNSIGLSCVDLLSVSGRRLMVQNHDLLDGSLILDIKPYLKYADSHPDASEGWITEAQPYSVCWSEEALQKVEWLGQQLNLNVKQIVDNQLAFEPTNKKIKRVKKQDNKFVFSYRTWRFQFQVTGFQVFVEKLYSGYGSEELLASEDPYGDKSIHRKINQIENLSHL